jgi:hypothetical protein
MRLNSHIRDVSASQSDCWRRQFPAFKTVKNSQRLCRVCLAKEVSRLNLKQFDLFVVLRDGFTERLRLAAAAFDDVLVKHGIVGHGIMAVIAGQAE